jgi:hypothetical protein
MPQSNHLGLERTLSNTSTGTVRGGNAYAAGDYGASGEDTQNQIGAGRHSEMNGNGRGLGGRPTDVGEVGNSIRREQRETRPIQTYGTQQAQSSPTPYRPPPPSTQRGGANLMNVHNNPFAERPRRTDSPSGFGSVNAGEELPWGAPFPSLHMWPLNETFATKMIHLPPITGRNPAERVSVSRSGLTNV